MNIIINHSSMIPIYEQITAQIKASVMDGILKADDALPSVRSLSKELKISALTVKKAYDRLEEEGFVVTIHGKGSFIAAAKSGTHAGRTPQRRGSRSGDSRFRKAASTVSPIQGDPRRLR